MSGLTPEEIKAIWGTDEEIDGYSREEQEEYCCLPSFDLRAFREVNERRQEEGKREIRLGEVVDAKTTLSAAEAFASIFEELARDEFAKCATRDEIDRCSRLRVRGESVHGNYLTVSRRIREAEKAAKDAEVAANKAKRAARAKEEAALCVVLETDFPDEAPIEDLELSIRAVNALRYIGHKTVGDIRRDGIDFRELRRTPNCGKETLKEIQEAFAPVS